MNGEALQRRQLVGRVLRQLDLVGGDPIEPDLGELASRCRERDRADHVRASCLFAVGQVCPHDGVGRDCTHRATSALIGCRAERGPSPDERTRTERRVHLVPRTDEEVEVSGVVVGSHVDRAMGGELSGIDEDPPTDAVDHFRQQVDRLHDSGHVRRA